MSDLFGTLLAAIVAVSTWSAPQPRHSAGLLVNYGSQRTVEANAAWRSYDLGAVPGRCGLSAISLAHLGQLAWVRVDGYPWQGPCLVVDAVARKDAYGSIYERGEVAEVSREMAQALGFEYGRPGEIYFGVCPPDPRSRPLVERYAPPLAWDHPPLDRTPSYFPYPAQQPAVDCVWEEHP